MIVMTAARRDGVHADHLSHHDRQADYYRITIMKCKKTASALRSVHRANLADGSMMSFGATDVGREE